MTDNLFYSIHLNKNMKILLSMFTKYIFILSVTLKLKLSEYIYK